MIVGNVHSCTTHILVVLKIFASVDCMGDVVCISCEIRHVFNEFIFFNVDVGHRIGGICSSICLKIWGIDMQSSSKGANILLESILANDYWALIGLYHDLTDRFILVGECQVLKFIQGIRHNLHEVFSLIWQQVTYFEVQLPRACLQNRVLDHGRPEVVVTVRLVLLHEVVLNIRHVLLNCGALYLDGAWESFDIEDMTSVVVRFKHTGHELWNTMSTASRLLVQIRQNIDRLLEGQVLEKTVLDLYKWLLAIVRHRQFTRSIH